MRSPVTNEPTPATPALTGGSDVECGDLPVEAPAFAEPSTADAGDASSGRRGLGWRLFRSSESAVAHGGVVLVAILIAAMATAALWSVQVQRLSIATHRRDQVRAAAEVLCGTIEQMIASGDLSAARRLVSDAGRACEFDHCDVILPDHTILAASEPSRITARRLPDPWPGGSAAPAAPQVQSVTRERISLSRPLKIPGHGNALLLIDAPISYPANMLLETQAGVGSIGAAALISLLLAYRALRSRLRGIGAVREALLALSRGERSIPALAVGPNFGPEAAAWNRLLAEREALDARAAICQARELLTERRTNKGDLASAIDAMAQGLILLDEQLKVKFANGAAGVFLQVKREEMLGTELARLVRDERVIQAVVQTAGGTVRRRTMIEIERTDERTGALGVLRFAVRPVRREDSAAAMVIIEDVTQQRVADRARNSFVAHVTHELRTPLTNIRLYVETAIDEGETNPVIRAKCLNVINQEVRRLENVIGEMLSVSEIEAGSLRLNRGELRLDTLFTELNEDFAAQAQDKGVQFKFNLPPKLPAIKADREKITLALHNLIGNALKYTPATGRVTVNVVVSQTQLTVAVNDTGIGISPEDQRRIFEMFYRARDPRVGKITGTGLGLTLAREIARLHGGDITVDSQLDKGSTFTLSCPITAEAV